MGKATLVSLHSLTGQAASSLPGRSFYSVSTHFVRRDYSGAMQALHPLSRPYGLPQCKEAFYKQNRAKIAAQGHRPVDRPDGARRFSITVCRRQTEPKESF